MDFEIELPIQKEVQDFRGDNPRIILIGEAPGKREAELGQPFVGPSEVELRKFWAGRLKRSEFYITNVCPVRPPGNFIEAIPWRRMLEYQADLRQKLRVVRNQHPICVIVPTGNTALRALWPNEDRNITDWRGSILEWEGTKVIPTIHPAATFRQPILNEFCYADWTRIVAEASSPDVTLPVRKHIIDPTVEEIDQWLEMMTLREQVRGLSATIAGSSSSDTVGCAPLVMAVDVENLRDRPRKVTCVGFSLDPCLSITIPLDDDTIVSAPLDYRRDAIKRICASAIPKVLQNGLTDQTKLAANGIALENYEWDLMEMAHALNPNDGGDTLSDDEVELGGPSIRISTKSLAVLTSLYTREPYYKHLGESPDWETRQKYNGLDACVTREIHPVLWGKLRERGLL